MNDQQPPYPQGYQYQQQGRQPSVPGSTPQQPMRAAAAYAPMASYAYDQSSQVYGYPQQQQQQQPQPPPPQQQQPTPQTQSQVSQPQPQTHTASSTPGSIAGSQYPQPAAYQTQVPQQYSSTGMPQYPYMASGYQMQQGAYSAQAAPSYGFPPYGVPSAQQDNSPYKPQSQLNVTPGSNTNLSQLRGPFQSATQPPMIDPNQVPQRPKLTTTFWEDENTVCYQVDARGVSVSRREDTNFINGTKLLNVAGMTRGRRDGILKSEKVRYVVKIGAMNLKGVWIPFERALELARNEGIVDLLYPLFVKDIKELYQGPQYSGGLTAAANSNPKNIVPVTVTNTSYTSAIYPPKEKKSSTAGTSTQPTSADSTHPAAAPSAHPDHSQYQYGYSGYPYPQEYGYNKGYYGYPQPAQPDHMPQQAAEDKAPEQK